MRDKHLLKNEGDRRGIGQEEAGAYCPLPVLFRFVRVFRDFTSANQCDIDNDNAVALSPRMTRRPRHTRTRIAIVGAEAASRHRGIAASSIESV